jgi:sulfite dehydrogenase
MSHPNPLRRRLVAGALAGLGAGAWSRRALAQDASIELPFVNGRRNLVAYPGKRPLIVLTARPPQLETPFEVFDEGVLTPNDAFFVRYHNAGIPTTIDADKHRIKVFGKAVGKPYELSLVELRTQFTPVELIAVNQCSGNGRALFAPRVTGGQTYNVFGGGDFVKALDMHHAMGGEPMIAWQMNGADIPYLNGYPVKLVVPGYYGTYWVKHLSAVEVIDSVYEGFWMKPAYRIPDNDCACIEPGTQPSATRPIGRFNVRSFITSLSSGQRVPAGQVLAVRGIAFDGGQGIREVAYSTDGGQSWREARLGADLGRFSFREFSFAFTPAAGAHELRTRAFNRVGNSQPMEPLWNPAGYMRNVVERVVVNAA